MWKREISVRVCGGMVAGLLPPTRGCPASPSPPHAPILNLKNSLFTNKLTHIENTLYNETIIGQKVNLYMGSFKTNREKKNVKT